MGAKASKDTYSSVVMIVLGGGKREMYSRPVSAQEVMLQHPQHVLIHQNMLRSDSRKAIVSPETVLLPGKKYYLVRRRTVEWLLGHRTDLTKTMSNLSASTSDKSDSGLDPLHVEINLGSGPKSMRMTLRDSIMASPQRSQEAVEQKPSITVARPKSPLGITRNNETSPRPWRSSPKVCPGEDESIWDEQISDIGSPGSVFANNVNNALQTDEGLPSYQWSRSGQESMEASIKQPLFQLLKYPDLNITTLVEDKQQCIPPSALEVNSEVHQSSKLNNSDLPLEEPVEIHNHIGVTLKEGERSPLLQLLKYPDLNITTLIEDKEQCILPSALEVKSDVHRSSKQNNSDLPVEEPAEVHNHIGVTLKEEERSALDDISCLHKDDKLHKQSEYLVIQEFHSHVDLGGIMIDKIHNITQACDNDKLWEDSLNEGTPIVELATCDDETTKMSQQKNECNTLSESLQMGIACIDLGSVMEWQQKEGHASMPPENMLDQPTSNLVHSLNEEESIQLCRSMEEDYSVLVSQTIHDSKAIDVDASNDEKSCKDLNLQPVPTFGGVLSWQSPNRMELVDCGIGEKNVCGTGDVSSLSLPASLPASPSSLVLSLLSSSSSASSSPSVSSLSASLPSSSLSLLTSGLSLASSCSRPFLASSSLSSSTPWLAPSLLSSSTSSSSLSVSALSLPVSGSSSSSLRIVSSMESSSSTSLPVSGLSSSSSSQIYFSSTLSSLSSSSSSLSSSLLSLASSSSSSPFALSSSSSAASLSSSFSSSPSSSASSQSQLMVLDLSKEKRGDQSQQHTDTQRNLVMLGFSSLRSDSVSIFEQAKAHRRAHLGEPWKIASSKMSSAQEQAQGQQRFHPSKQQTKEAPFSRLSPRRLHNLLLQRFKQPLSPIREFSPEQSPDCPPSST